MGRPDRCPGCGGVASVESHTCPYKVEIDWDHEECWCCEGCEDNCGDEI